MDWTGYGDATKTGDKKYVLASFRADANLGWVVDLRSLLSLSELKYKDYLPKRHLVASNARIQANLNKGLAEAELTIIDVSEYLNFAYVDLLGRGAEPLGDFDMRTIHEMAADEMLRDSPFSLRKAEMHRGFLADASLMIRRASSAVLQELPDFDPSELRRRAGGKLRDVQSSQHAQTLC